MVSLDEYGLIDCAHLIGQFYRQKKKKIISRDLNYRTLPYWWEFSGSNNKELAAINLDG